MSEATDREIRAMVVELIETSPSPHPFVGVLASDGRRPSGIGRGVATMAAVAVAVLVIATAGVLVSQLEFSGDGRSSEVFVVAGEPAPKPDAGVFFEGEELRLVSASGQVFPDVRAEDLDGDVVAVGQIEGTNLEVFTWRTHTDPGGGSCLQVIGFRARHSVCSAPVPPGKVIETPLTFPRLDEDTGDPIDVVVVWPVPERTSVVTLTVTSEDGDELRIWQQPVGGVAAFTVDPHTTLASFEAFTSKGESIGGRSVRP